MALHHRQRVLWLQSCLNDTAWPFPRLHRQQSSSLPLAGHWVPPVQEACPHFLVPQRVPGPRGLKASRRQMKMCALAARSSLLLINDWGDDEPHQMWLDAPRTEPEVCLSWSNWSHEHHPWLKARIILSTCRRLSITLSSMSMGKKWRQRRYTRKGRTIPVCRTSTYSTQVYNM